MHFFYYKYNFYFISNYFSNISKIFYFFAIFFFLKKIFEKKKFFFSFWGNISQKIHFSKINLTFIYPAIIFLIF